jgi:hypothetical protein
MEEEKYEADPKGAVAGWAKLGRANPTETLCKSCHKYDEHFSFSEKFKKIAHPR